MKFYHFTEMPYPYLPPLETHEEHAGYRSRTGSLIRRSGADLYNRYLDEYVIADELGLDIMLNEHHQTGDLHRSCGAAAGGDPGAADQEGAHLILGNPIANRGEPIRIAEEMAMIDCISRGRLDVGFVRGVPTEIYPANSNPTMTAGAAVGGRSTWRAGLDDPRRPVQLRRPHLGTSAPSMSGRDPTSSRIRRSGSPGRAIARTSVRSRSTATPSPPSCSPTRTRRMLFDIYREHYVDGGVPDQGGMAFMPLVYTADSEAEAERARRSSLWYTHSEHHPAVPQPAGLRAECRSA